MGTFDNSSSSPFVSVVLAVRNEEKSILKTLESIAAQDYPSARFEVVIADGESQDRTTAIVAEFIRDRPGFRLVRNPGRIVACGLNEAIRCSQGEVIVRVDGHTLLEKDYVSCCVSALKETGADNAGGRMYAVGVGLQGQALAEATSSPFGIGNAFFHFSRERRWVDTVYLGAWRRETFKKYGLFDEALVRNQDDELNYRIRSGGGRVLLTPEIRSTYFVRASFAAAFRQYFQYGFWKVRVLQKHPRQMKVRQFVPGLFFAALAVLAGFSPVFTGARILLTALLIAYTLSAMAAAFPSALKKGPVFLPVVSAAFGVLHIAYGLGWCAGLAAFAGSWGDRHGKVPELSA